MIDAPPPADLPSPERLQELLFDAARIGRGDVVPALVRFGADLEAHDAKGHTALILACYNDRAETAALLLDLGAVPDAPDTGRGNTALMGVAFKGHAAIARLLLDRGAAPDARNREGQTALMLAALFGREEIVGLLLGYGADPGLVDTAGNDAGALAAAQGNMALAARLAAAAR